MRRATKLIMMRHGESYWNKQNLFSGWIDIPLTQKGIEEALAAGERIAHLPIDLVFVSALARAQMTAFLALTRHRSQKTPILLHREKAKTAEWSKIYSREAERNSIPVVVAWQLNERMYGELQGLNKSEVREKFGEVQFKEWRRSYAVAPPGGESLKMTAERTIPYFNEVIVPELAQGKNVFISAHGNSLRSIIMELEGLSEQQVVELELGTGVPIVYNYLSGKFVKQPDL